jgi:hypothetical protein
MSSTVYEPVADTEGTSSPSPTHSRKYRIIALAFVLPFSFLALASLYKFGQRTVPSAWVGPQPTSSPSPTTFSQGDIEEPAVPKNETGTVTEMAMPHGKYSVG